HAQPEYELACGRGQPIGFMAGRSGILDVDLDGAVGIRNEAGAVADAVPVDPIPHEVISRIAHGERPERTVRRALSCRKVHDVVVLAGELLTRAVYFRSPVHGLLRYVYWAREFTGTCGSQEHAFAGFAASEHGGPAIDLCYIGVRDDLERDEPQHAANDDSLHYVRDDVSRPEGREQSESATAILRTTWLMSTQVNHHAAHDKPQNQGDDNPPDHIVHISITAHSRVTIVDEVQKVIRDALGRLEAPIEIASWNGDLLRLAHFDHRLPTRLLIDIFNISVTDIRYGYIITLNVQTSCLDCVPGNPFGYYSIRTK